MNTFPDLTGNVTFACQSRLTRASWTYDIIVRRVAGLTHVSSDHLAWPGRGRAHHVAARHVAIYLAVIEAQLSQSALATVTGRHRATVAHVLRRVEARRDADPCFDRALDVAAHLVRRDLGLPCDRADTQSAPCHDRQAA